MTLAISPQARDALERWLEAGSALRGLAKNTLTAYRADVLDFIAFMTHHHGGTQGLGPLSQLSTGDMRAWMAHLRQGGAGSRSMARKLSAVKAFYGWLAEREGY